MLRLVFLCVVVFVVYVAYQTYKYFKPDIITDIENAEAVAQHKQVPDVMFGASAANGSAPTADLLSMMAMKAAKDLSLDLNVKK